MTFPKWYGEMAARVRVPAGVVVAIVFLVLARPSWQSLAFGGGFALLGLLLRGWAAGHLAKYERLATAGPYAYVRNPLYLGTLIIGAGLWVAGAHTAVGIGLLGFFVLFYLPVIEEEERYLRGKFPDYAAYARRAPRFWPRLRPAYQSGDRFRFALYRKNREYQAWAVFGVVVASPRRG